MGEWVSVGLPLAAFFELHPQEFVKRSISLKFVNRALVRSGGLEEDQISKKWGGEGY